MEEIIEHVHFEIRNSGFEKKLIAGIVITGGGAQLRHIVQLVEFITGMDTRIGYPNEHLGKGADDLKSPMFATGVGLVIKGYQDADKQKSSAAKVVVEEKGTRAGKLKAAKVTQPTQRQSLFEMIADIFKEEKDREL
jgi:cell division protein FtsA